MQVAGLKLSLPEGFKKYDPYGTVQDNPQCLLPSLTLLTMLRSGSFQGPAAFRLPRSCPDPRPSFWHMLSR